MKVRAACETFSSRTFLILRYLSSKSSLSERGLSIDLKVSKTMYFRTCES